MTTSSTASIVRGAGTTRSTITCVEVWLRVSSRDDANRPSISAAACRISMGSMPDSCAMCSSSVRVRPGPCGLRRVCSACSSAARSNNAAISFSEYVRSGMVPMDSNIQRTAMLSGAREPSYGAGWT